MATFEASVIIYGKPYPVEAEGETAAQAAQNLNANKPHPAAQVVAPAQVNIINSHPARPVGTKGWQ